MKQYLEWTLSLVLLPVYYLIDRAQFWWYEAENIRNSVEDNVSNPVREKMNAAREAGVSSMLLDRDPESLAVIAQLQQGCTDCQTQPTLEGPGCSCMHAPCLHDITRQLNQEDFSSGLDAYQYFELALNVIGEYGGFEILLDYLSQPKKFRQTLLCCLADHDVQLDLRAAHCIAGLLDAKRELAQSACLTLRAGGPIATDMLYEKLPELSAARRKDLVGLLELWDEPGVWSER